MTNRSPILAEDAKVYRCPKTRRRYFTKRAAYASLAKRLILDRCECEPNNFDTGFPVLECDIHRELFNVPAWACNVCVTPDGPQGAACLTCEQHGRCTVACSIVSTERYLKLKRRLTSWLLWADGKR